MKNSKQPINPFVSADGTPYDSNYLGLTKREYFAGLAMQGILASDWGKKITSDGKADLILIQIIPASIRCADTLLKELENQK